MAEPRVKVPAPLLVSVPAPVRVAVMVPLARVTWPASIEPPVSSPPAMVTLLAMVWPPRSRMPPLMATAPVEKAVAEPAVRVPAATVVPPVKRFAPVRVTAPVPALVKPVVPVRTAPIVPALAVTLPRARVPLTREPPLRMKLLARACWPRSRVPPLTVTVLAPKAPTEPAARVPAVTNTPSVKVLAPERVRMPVPLRVKPPVPVRTAATVPALAVSWPRVSEPLAIVPASSVMALAIVCWPRSRIPPSTVTALRPRASVEPSWRVPAKTSTPPVKVLKPESTRVPALFFTKPAEPSMVAETSPVVAFSCERSTIPLASVPPATLMVFVREPEFRSKVPPVTVTTLSAGMASGKLGRRVPPVTVVEPV